MIEKVFSQNFPLERLLADLGVNLYRLCCASSFTFMRIFNDWTRFDFAASIQMFSPQTRLGGQHLRPEKLDQRFAELFDLQTGLPPENIDR